MMRLRGAFDPRIQMGITVVVLAAVALLVYVTVNSYVEGNSWRLDLRSMPLGLLLGLAVGALVGIWRLRALRKAVPELHDQFFLSQANMIARFPEGANATTLQRAAFGWAFIVWFALTAFTQGHVILYGSLGCYILGQFLTGQTLPFIRLWRELKRNSCTL